MKGSFLGKQINNLYGELQYHVPWDMYRYLRAFIHNKRKVS